MPLAVGIGSIVRRGFRLAAASILAACLAGCSAKPAAEDAAASDAPPAVESAPPSDDAPNIRNVVDLWSAAGDETLRALVELTQTQPPRDRLQPYSFSEEYVIALSQEERDRLVIQMTSTSTALLQIAREVRRRAGLAAMAGTADQIEESMQQWLSVKRVGAANRGPELTKHMNILGEALEQMAEEGLAALEERRPARESSP